MSSVFKPIGATNFQFLVIDGKIRLLEINPRISSSTSIRLMLNYNESQMSIDYFFNQVKIKPINRSSLNGTKIARYIQEIML